MPLSYLACLLLGLAGSASSGAQISERELQEAIAEGDENVKAQTVEMDFVIVKSTASYGDARRAANGAAKRLGVRLDLRNLSPHSEGGLTWSKKECEDDAFDYPCYVARGGRADDGFYVSIEYSTAYTGFKPGLYIVVVASDTKGGQVAKLAAKAARKAFKDAYVRRTGVYLGCLH
jgi:hypothetical protein